MGRPSKITDELEQKFCELVMLGNSWDAACGECGITDRTFRYWMIRGQSGKKGDERYRKFYERVRSAEATAESALLSEVRSAAQGDWRAATWMLERRWSKRWGYKAQVEVTVRSEFQAMIAVIERVCGPKKATEVFNAWLQERELEGSETVVASGLALPGE